MRIKIMPVDKSFTAKSSFVVIYSAYFHLQKKQAKRYRISRNIRREKQVKLPHNLKDSCFCIIYINRA